jgi:hypothetical protein
MFLAQRVLNIESPERSGSYVITAKTVANYLVLLGILRGKNEFKTLIINIKLYLSCYIILDHDILHSHFETGTYLDNISIT